MSETRETKRLPRKILGMNSQIPSSDSTNSHSTESLEKSSPQSSESTSSMDRMRFVNIMNQEMPSVWPYGTFLSPVLPAANLAVPYAIAPNMPYAAVPLYQAVANGTATSGGSSGQQQSQQSSNSREPSKMLIQIGLQCVNQNNPVNINSMNDMTTSLGKFNLHFDQAENRRKDDSSSLRSSPTSSGGKDREMCDFNKNSCLGAGDPSHIVLSQTKFDELKALALAGSEIAEKLAYTHRNRPCFKKIDSLCARMKQDLIRPDGVLPNINSQGIAWAVKDFIFVFTRVINAWIIIKGYVYNTPEGLNKVRSALSPDFVRSFAEWQDSTVDFVENLMKSFVNLDNLVQAQKNIYQKVTTTPMKCSSDESIDFLNSSIDSGMSKETVNKNYLYTMVEDSDATQRQNTLNGAYFKTGTYNFIKRDCMDDGAPTGLDQFFDETFAKSMPDICPTYNPSPSQIIVDESKLIRVLEDKLSVFSAAYDPNLAKPLGNDLVDKLNVFMHRLMEVKSADLFFKIQFCRNYFPDFISQTPDFVDLRTIIMKCQVGAYGHIFEMVHDIKLIIHQARTYLKKQPHPELEKAITSFEVDVEKILTEEPFENYLFDHIKGEPNEVLYNSGK